MSKVIPLFRGIEGWPVTDELRRGWDMIRRLDDNLHGIAEVKSLDALEPESVISGFDHLIPSGSPDAYQRDSFMFEGVIDPFRAINARIPFDEERERERKRKFIEAQTDNPTPDELRDRWSRMNMHEGGIEWDGPLPNWTPGLKVTEEGGMGEG